jgi:post-segregation antitoxin (ccd killing protein)
MEIYTEIQTFKISKVQKETLNKLKTQKVNISKFIRDAINEKIEREQLVKEDNRKKYTIEYLTQLLNNSF